MMSFKDWVLYIIYRRTPQTLVQHQLPCEVLTDSDRERIDEITLRMSCKDMPIEVVLNERTGEWSVYTDTANFRTSRMQLVAMAVAREDKRRFVS